MLTKLGARRSESPGRHASVLALAAATLLLTAASASADTITFGGQISQSLGDSGATAVNNPGLGNILDGDDYLVTLMFPGSITGAGSHNPLAGATLLFQDLSHPVSESSFDPINISVLTDGSFFDISLFACLTSGGCLTGNSLSVNFQIPAAGLNSQNVTAQTILGLSPALDLLEDESETEIQGSVKTYSYVSASAVPEPSTMAPLLLLLAALVWMRLRRPYSGKETL